MANAQFSENSILIIDSLGTYTEKLPFSLIVKIKNDTINIAPILNFKIISKIKEEWNSSFTEGITSYDTELIDHNKSKKATINIIFRHSDKKFIEIKYEYGEARILNIKKILPPTDSL